jgi:radical SAM protein with 4Fe4S-binding SPASM domain
MSADVSSSDMAVVLQASSVRYGNSTALRISQLSEGCEKCSMYGVCYRDCRFEITIHLRVQGYQAAVVSPIHPAPS